MRGWAAYLMAVTLAVCAVPAAASAGHDAPQRSDCHAGAAMGETLAAVAADAGRWRCDSAPPSLQTDRTVLRFASNGQGSEARFFGTQPAIFEGLSLAVIQGGKIVAERHYDANDLVTGPRGNLFLVPIPAHDGRADAVLAAFDRPTAKGLFDDARLYASDPSTAHAAMAALLIAAIVCGMLIMPLAFNAAYYRVLREKFVLWHLAVSCAWLAQCLLTSGVIGHFVDLPVAVHARLVISTFGMGVAAAAAFCASVIEPRKLDPRLRRGLYIGAGQVLIVSVLHTLLPNLFRSVQNQLFYASFVPVLIFFALVMADAWKRGSRAVRYQIVGWAPFMLMGIIRLATMLAPAAQNDAMQLFYFAMVVESIATSLGVADRFMMIKRQRDRALSRAKSLERLSERDDLTGLYNRRALDGRLGDFAVQQFTGFALFDLDNFKRVNDTHGHAVGDAVLRTVANVLEGHDDAVALRMGGEEFLLLLRGASVSERVERLREAIPVRIAREVTELEILVTASTGLVEAAREGDIGSDFVALYRTADDLLYEAKHHGRNMLAAVTLPSACATPATAAA